MSNGAPLWGVGLRIQLRCQWPRSNKLTARNPGHTCLIPGGGGVAEFVIDGRGCWFQVVMYRLQDSITSARRASRSDLA